MMRWLRPGLADLVFLLVAVAVLRGAAQTLLDDPGVGWHLRNIDAMLAQGGWLTQDPFSDHGDTTARWYTNQWLGELPAWLGWKWAGLEGIAVANAVVIGLLARWLYFALVQDGLTWPVAILWTALGMLGTSCSWNARPNVFTIVFVFLIARLLVGLHDGRVSRWQAAWVVPLMTLWANIHGGFVAGLVMLGLAFAVEVGSALFSLETTERARAVGRAGYLAVLSLAGFLATLINPYGTGLYPWVVGLLGDPFFMDLHQEWRSPDFHSPGAIRYELLLLLFPAILALSERRSSLLELAFSLFWLHQALTGFRYVALWVVVVVPVLALASIRIRYLNDLARRLHLTSEPGSLFHTQPGKQPWLILLVLVAALLLTARGLEGKLAVHKQEIIASHAMDALLARAREFLVEKGRRPVIFHHYDWGGYLTWHGWPDLKNWIDDRNEVQGKERIQQYFDIAQAADGWEQHLARVDLVCLAPDQALARELARRPREWLKLHLDAHGVVFERLAR